jgi:hypothetical protein
MRQSLGEKLSPILSEIEDTLLDNYETKPGFNDEGFRASIFIFQSVLLDKMWELQEKEDIQIETRADMATKCGEAIRSLVKTFTDIDTYNLYK